MKIFERKAIKKVELPGRIIQSAVGKNAIVDSQNMAVGFAHYSMESGPMEPHNHAEETIYVLESRDGWVRFGPEKDKLGEKIPLYKGTILHFPAYEWHVFGFEPEGLVDIIFIYGQVENNRPEDKT